MNGLGFNGSSSHGSLNLTLIKNINGVECFNGSSSHGSLN